MTSAFLPEPLIMADQPFESAAKIVEKTLRSARSRDPKSSEMYLVDEPLCLGDFLDSLCPCPVR